MAGYVGTTVVAGSAAARGEGPGDDGSISITPVPSDRVAAALFGGDASDRDRAAMDAAGNANGRLDVGDLRAAVFGRIGARPAVEITAMSAGGDAQSQARSQRLGNAGNNRGNDGAHGDVWVLVLTGALSDGTTLWAEDTARIIGESR